MTGFHRVDDNLLCWQKLQWELRFPISVPIASAHARMAVSTLRVADRLLIIGIMVAAKGYYPQMRWRWRETIKKAIISIRLPLLISPMKFAMTFRILCLLRITHDHKQSDEEQQRLVINLSDQFAHLCLQRSMSRWEMNTPMQDTVSPVCAWVTSSNTAQEDNSADNKSFYR